MKIRSEEQLDIDIQLYGYSEHSVITNKIFSPKWSLYYININPVKTYIFSRFRAVRFNRISLVQRIFYIILHTNSHLLNFYFINIYVCVKNKCKTIQKIAALETSKLWEKSWKKLTPARLKKSGLELYFVLLWIHFLLQIWKLYVLVRFFKSRVKVLIIESKDCRKELQSQNCLWTLIF